MILHQFKNNDTLHRLDTALVAHFSGKRKVLSTAPHNGGFRENLTCVFNQDCKHDHDSPSRNDLYDNGMKAPTYAQHMAVIAAGLGLDPAAACGLSTAADMDHVSIQVRTYADTTVTAVITAGIDVNGGRVGETAQWHETQGKFVNVPGTINILLFIEADLSEGAMAQALVTCTEAKTAAVQELMAPSCYSCGIATGSGTDGTMIISDADSGVKLTFAGKHCKLGELIGRAVMAGVKEALFLQTGLCADQQSDIFRRIGRFGVTEKSIWDRISGSSLTYTEFCLRLGTISRRTDLVIYTLLYVHLLDELEWGLIEAKDACSAGSKILFLMDMNSDISAGENDADSNGITAESERKKMITEMVRAYNKGLSGIICTENCT